MKREKGIRMGLVRFSPVCWRAKKGKRGGKIKRNEKGEGIRKRDGKRGFKRGKIECEMSLN